MSETIIGKGGVGIIHGGLFSISAKEIIPVVQKKVRTDINIKKQDGLIGHDSVMNNVIISVQNDQDYPVENIPHIIYADEFEIITENVAPNPETDTDLEISIASNEQKAKVIADAIKAVREGLHEKGLVHRDIKPGNIIVQVDKNGVVKGYIIDFGLAEYVRKDEKYGKDILSDRARKQVVYGTPGYFDPEIFYEYDENGKYVKTRSVKETQEISLRPETDQFSFAVTILAKIFGFSTKRFMSENNLNSKQFTLAILLNFELYRNALIKSLDDIQDEQLKEILHISIMRMKNQKKATEDYEKKYGNKPDMKELEIRLRTLVH
jgi:serine/threonine protein kinase